MAIYKQKNFVRFARGEKLDDVSLVKAIEDATRGLIDADLGGGLIKQRVARKGKGKSGGYRTLIAFRSGELAVFMMGFAKSDQDNIDDAKLLVLRDLAAAWLATGPEKLKEAVEQGQLVEVRNDEKQDEESNEAAV